MRKVIQAFKNGNVSVCGMRGTGKDMLFANVVARRKKPYVSNVDYGGDRYPFEYSKIDCGGNTYRNFIEGNVNRYEYPYEDGVDFYISDCGVYFPSQYCSELNRYYGNMATFQALTRHLGECNFHTNCQNLNRVWDKIREQSDTYIMCNWCKVILHKIVLQKVTFYEKYESAVARVRPNRIRRPVTTLNDKGLQAAMYCDTFDNNHGEIKSRILIYWNKAKYDTRVFKRIMEGKEE